MLGVPLLAEALAVELVVEPAGWPAEGLAERLAVQEGFPRS